MLDSAAELPAALSRAVAVTTAWNLLVWGDLAAKDFVRCATAVLRSEIADSLIEHYLSLAVEAADMWSPDSLRDRLLGQVADICLELSTNAARRQVAVRALTQTATTEEQIAALRNLAGDDVDLRWRTLSRLAEFDAVDPAEVDQLAHHDPDPDSWLRALAVDSARPDPAKKEATWKAMTQDHKVPRGALANIGRVFWRRSQGEILAPYADRYLQVLPTLHLGGMISALGLTNALYPKAGVGTEFAEKAVAAAKGDGISPAVAKAVIESTDRLNRMLKTRAL
jgi:aminopeptidase N